MGARDENDIVRRLADGEDPWVIDPEHGCTNPLTGYFPSAEVETEKRRRALAAQTEGYTRDVTTPTAHQLSILNALVTYTAENVPGGLSPEESDVAKIVGGWALKGKMVPEPDVTVELKSVQVTDHEVEESAWSVVMSGTWGDCTVCTSVSREFASAQAGFLTECLKIVLGDGHVTLELPS